MADSVELPGSVVAESEFASEMEITVQSDAVHNYVFLAYHDNIVEDVLVKILGSDRAGRAPEPRLFFNDLELEKQKTLAEYGIKPDSVLQLKCTPRVLVQADDATEIAEMHCVEPSSSMRPNGDDHEIMKIYVRSKYYGNYALEVDSSMTIQDVLVTVLPVWQLQAAQPEPKLYFNGHLLERANSLADYGIQDRSVLHLERTDKVLDFAISPTEIAKMGNANSEPPVRPNGDDEMKIFVRSKYFGNYALEVDSSNTIQDVLVTVLPIWAEGMTPEPKLYFNGRPLKEKAKSLADYSIQDGSILHLNKCTAWKSCRANDLASPTTVRPSGDGELKIFVRSLYQRSYALESYALEVDSSNTIKDVLDTIDLILLVFVLGNKVYFNGHLLERAKSLADYGIEDGSILILKRDSLHRACSANVRERPNRIPARDRIMITDRPLAIWEKEYDKVFLSLLVEQISIGGRNNILYPGMDSWCNIVAKFNELTGLKYEYKHLYSRFEFYEREYQIVNDIRSWPMFSWDHQRQVVIATDATWNHYTIICPDARHYRRRAIPYIDLLETIFANKEEPEITL